MARKSMDRLNGFDSRQAIWDEIRRRRDGFTVRELRESTTLGIETVREYVTGLVNAGYVGCGDITRIGCLIRDCVPATATVLAPKSYTLLRDVGIEAPRVRKDGTPVTQGQGTHNMWRTMRILKTFSARELAISASTETCAISPDTAKSYTRYLCNAGYLRKTGDRYCFIPSMHTGPKPPMIQRVKRVWDQNLKKVMWSEEGDNDQ